MFSRRLPWHLPQNKLSQAIEEKRRAQRPLLDLTVSNPTAALFDGVYEPSLLASLADARGLRYQPSARGDSDARQAISAYYAQRGLRAEAEKLVLCASTSEAYSWLFQLLCNPGERVLFPRPSYPLLEFLGGLGGVEVAPYPLHFDGLDGRWRIDFAALREGLTRASRAIVCVSPNNPTGSLLHAGEVAALFSLCREYGVALIVDEVFGDYLVDPIYEVGDPPLPSLIFSSGDADAPLSFTLSGLSKVVGLPQLKLGWIYVGGPEPLRSEAQDRLEIIADTYLSVGTPVQLATPHLLREQPRIATAIAGRVRRNLAALRVAVRDSALNVLPVEGGWYAVVRLPQLCSEEDWVMTLLQKDDVLVHPGYFFDFSSEAYVVISLLTPPEQLDAGIARIISRTLQL